MSHFAHFAHFATEIEILLSREELLYTIDALNSEM